jgi:pyruvate-ferredoxin/flavodoxin oxidoreductase
MDFALIAQMATLEARLPFLHFFDGFRTSHEVAKVEQLSSEDIRELIDDELVLAHRSRGLSPDRPFIRGTSQNPDVFFQARESVNSYYNRGADIVQGAMDKFAGVVGRQYHLFDYVGAKDADRVIVMMGSGAETAEETVNYLTGQGEKVGLLKVRWFRPFSIKEFVKALPPSVRAMAVLDRTKEPGSTGEPLYLDVVTAVSEMMASGEAPFPSLPKIVGGRYGLSSKEFTPGMVKGIFDELKKDAPKNHFTIGINDDLTHTSLEYDASFSTGDAETTRALFYGLGSDGTVGANKNSIKIIGEGTDDYAQGYFVYDSKKAGTVTVSHLRFGPKPIQSTYLISQADFVALHQFTFLERMNVLKHAKPGGTFLLNSPYAAEDVWERLPLTIRREIVEKGLKFYVVDGYEVAKQCGMGRRINTIMQACFFAISGILPKKQAIEKIKQAIEATYGKRGKKVVQQNFKAVDMALDYLHEVDVPKSVGDGFDLLPPVPPEAPEFVRDVLGAIIAGEGNALPVSALPQDGTYPSGTTQWEKRNLALEIPVWETDICIQCGKCVFVCPHAVIREKVYAPELVESAPETFKYADARWKEFKGEYYSLQVAPEDCTGCVMCVEACPVVDKKQPDRKALNMAPQRPLREPERENWEFFLELPEVDRTAIKLTSVKNTQLLQPLFEFSGACSGCGETPYLKLITQLYGDRAVIANATGCSSIFGGNLPTTPWAVNADGRGPAWSNSLFEDNAEFGLGMRITLDKQIEDARGLLSTLKGKIGETLVDEILGADQADEAGIQTQRERVAMLREKLMGIDTAEARHLESIAEALVERSVWIVGGDGWAYDIGYGGLDHVLASGRNVNILVLDTEVYSNTGGQASKATPRAAAARFASNGKDMPKKDLGLIAMTYGNVYVAQIAMGASDKQTLQAILEAEAYPGPSLVIAYSHCIAHGIDMTKGLTQQALAVQSGYWPLYRYNPENIRKQKNPMSVDSKKPSVSLEEYAYNESRYRALVDNDEDRSEELMRMAKKDLKRRGDMYRHLAAMEIEEEEV